MTVPLLSGGLFCQAQTDLHVFAGTWKQDLAKSRYVPSSNEVVSYERQPDGFWVEADFTGAATLHRRFRMDGKDYPVDELQGATIASRNTGPGSWEFVLKSRDETRTMRAVISPDGKRMTTTITVSRSNEVITREYARTTGSDRDLAGTWKLVSRKSNTPETIRILVTPDGGLIYDDAGAGFEARLDGKEYPYTGGRVRTNVTVSLQSINARALRVTYLHKHQPIFENEWRVSADGGTLSISGKDPNAKEPPSLDVYEKQR